MEFEKNAPITAEDITRSEIPRKIIEPVHSSIEPPVPTTPGTTDSEAKQVFSFESESTANLVTDSEPQKRSYFLLITVVALIVVVAAVAIAIFIYLPR